MVDVRRGKTTSRIMRSCDTVNAGAFFPQPQFQVVWSKNSCGFAVVIPEQPTEPFATLYWLRKSQICLD